MSVGQKETPKRNGKNDLIKQKDNFNSISKIVVQNLYFIGYVSVLSQQIISPEASLKLHQNQNKTSLKT